MLQPQLFNFPLYYLSGSRVRKVRNKGKFRTFNSKTGGSRFLEVVVYKEVPNMVI